MHDCPKVTKTVDILHDQNKFRSAPFVRFQIKLSWATTHANEELGTINLILRVCHPKQTSIKCHHPFHFNTSFQHVREYK
jgi:hypothetical protein